MSHSAASLYTVRPDCRLCRGQQLETVLSLPATPPANAYLRQEKLAEPEPFFPLTVALCRDCGLVQLREVVSPEHLFRQYIYVSSTSPAFVNHFITAAEQLTERFGIPAGSLIVDIGSNDGILLRPYQERGMRVLGIDPATAIAEQATTSGIPTIPEFFTEALAMQLRDAHGSAHFIGATNVFAHIDDVEEIVRGVKQLLAPQGVFVFENAYLIDFLEQTLFDTVYHEHLCYYSVQPLIPFFRRFGLEVFAAERISTHGGSIRVFVGHAGAHAVEPSVAERLAEEAQADVTNPSTYQAFSARVTENAKVLRSLLNTVRAEGGTVAGYGAPAKATTLLHAAGITRDDFTCVVDDSSWKQGLHLPGNHIPVVSYAQFAEAPTSHLLILAWNFAPQIIEKLAAYRAQGGKCIVPVPTPHIV